MEGFLILVGLVFLAVPFILLAMLASLRKVMRDEFSRLGDRLDQLSNQLKSFEGSPRVENVVVKLVEKKPEIVTPPPIVQEFKKPEPEVKKVEEPPVIKPIPVPPTPKVEIDEPLPVVEHFDAPKIPDAPKRPGFFERNPDLEKFIGENLANKIGIAILVVGIGFFVKYAIDQNWINEIGRVFIGILCGGILLGVAHWLRKTLQAFSSVLVGGGIAVLYLTIAIAFHEYHLFGQVSAFLLMVGITGFAIVFSLAYDRKELAVLSLLGGFASPFMVSTGEGNYVVLFVYVLILDIGMMVLSYYKKWPIINIIAYFFTILLFGSWLGARYDYETPGMTVGAMIFATAFYLVFFAMNLINNLRMNIPFKALEFSLLLTNTFFYFGAGMAILTNPITEDYRGLFTAVLAVFNFGFAYSLFRSSKADKNLVYLLIGLVLTFISLAAPIQLKGNYITLFWSAEAVLLLWLSQKSGIKLMKLSSYVVVVLMLISLVMDWGQLYDSYSEVHMTAILNKGYITGLFVIASLIGTVILLRKETETTFINPVIYRNTIIVLAVIVIYATNLLEAEYQLRFYYVDDYYTQLIGIGTYNMFFIMMLMLVESRLQMPEKLHTAFAVFPVLGILAYIISYHSTIVGARYDSMVSDLENSWLGWHYALVLFLVVAAILGVIKTRKMTEFNKRTSNIYSWFYVAFFVGIASIELDNLVLLLAFDQGDDYFHILSQNQKIGYPILWGVTSFILIFVGLRSKIRHVRIISLTLFLVTLVKLFVFDIQGISQVGKIAAFISLGILLLIVSFMYQRLKKILLDDTQTESNEKTTVS